jgi:predicted acetyltransferase
LNLFYQNIPFGLKFWKFSKNHAFDSVLDEKNNYVGYYEIEDIMSFFTKHHFKRTWKNNKIKKLDYSMSQILK